MGSPAEKEFSDIAYQSKLPMHARSTASQAVKNNLRITELMADKNLILGQQKVGILLLGSNPFTKTQNVDFFICHIRKHVLKS